jgi:hypothetical protein
VGHLVTYGLPRDELVGSVLEGGCAVLPALANQESLMIRAGTGIFPVIVPTTTGSADTLPLENWYLWDAGWYGFMEGIVGAPWALDMGILAVGVLRRMRWADPAHREATCFSRDGGRDCVPGVSVELSGPSSGIVYVGDDGVPVPGSERAATTPGGGFVAGNVPPGLHTLTLHLPEGVTCDAEIGNGASGWAMETPNVLRVPVIAGTATATALFCDDTRSDAERAQAP